MSVDSLEPTKYAAGPVTAYRSNNGYGWQINLGRRVQWQTRRGLVPALPYGWNGTDENCNRATSLALYPLGSLTIWWEPRWRTTPCDTCKADFRAEGCCEECGCRPCCCDVA